MNPVFLCFKMTFKPKIDRVFDQVNPVNSLICRAGFGQSHFFGMLLSLLSGANKSQLPGEPRQHSGFSQE